MAKISSLFLILFVFPAYSLNIDLSGEPLRRVSVSGVDIPVYENVKLMGVEKAPVPLKLSGGGIREKTVIIASVNVYMLLSYTDLKSLDLQDPLKSLGGSRHRLLRMTFLRDVDAGKIRDSFADALKENDVSLEEPGIKALLSALQFDVKKGGSVEIVGSRPVGAPEKLSLVFPGKTIEAEGKTVVSDFWKIWFGKPADGGLKDLKARLLSLDQLMHM